MKTKSSFIKFGYMLSKWQDDIMSLKPVTCNAFGKYS